VAGLRIGVIGVGRIGTMHARTLLELAGVADIAVADVREDRALQVAAELGVRAATLDAMFAGSLDGLVVAASTPAHASLIRRALQAEVPVFCEKPVALDLATLDALRDEAEPSGAFVQVGFQRRFDQGYLAVRKAVTAGEIGTLLVLRAATHDPAPPPEEYIASSGGIFRDLNIHDFDAIRFVTGSEIAEVYADGAVRETLWFERHGDVDAAAAVLRLEDGSLGLVSGTRRDPRGYDVRLELLGTADSVAVGDQPRAPYRSLEAGAAPPGRGYRDFLERFAPAYRAELDAFVAAVAGGGRSPCTLTDARAALAVALAAERSRREHRPVHVDEPTAGAT
jgi:myo-inositol 2-dehydrogenase / D-chiro-inositol 1-dehydrogenase